MRLRSPSRPADRRGLRSRRSGFTLTELLVSLGLIAVLLGIVIAAFGRARQGSNAVRCTANLRNIATLTLTYTADHQGRFPGSRWVSNANVMTWYSRLTHYIDATKAAEITGYPPGHHFWLDFNQAWDKLICPNQKTSESTRYQGIFRTYGYHMCRGVVNHFSNGYGILDWQTGHTRRVTELTNPAQTVLFIEVRNLDYIYAEMWVNFSQDDGVQRYLLGRHSEGYVAAFCDGSVRLISSTDIQDPSHRMWRAFQ